jgi:hypothetical protein
LPAKRWRFLASSKLAELNETIAQISRMKQVLVSISRCKCPSLDECGIRARRSGVVKIGASKTVNQRPGRLAKYR